MKVLLINGHQRYEGFAEGKLNQAILDETGKQLATAGHQLKSTIVESGYDIAAELEKFQWPIDCDGIWLRCFPDRRCRIGQDIKSG